MNTKKLENKRNTLIVAHRGLSGIERENTCAAFVAAGNRSYFGIECDVHRTVDGKYVVIHDDNTARVGIDRLVVEESTYDTLRALQLTDKDGVRGRSDLRIPSLEEYISICKKYEKTAVLELKNHFEAGDVAEICDVIDSLDYLESTIFISFDFENLVFLKAARSEARAQFLISSFPEDLLDRLTANGFDLDISHKALTAELVELCHSRGVRVNCWTVDDPERAAELIEWGVDYITTNILE